MSNYFYEPKCFKGVNCKKVPGEQTRKKCREWNKLIAKIQKLRREGKIAEAEELECRYLELWEFERSLKPSKKKRC